MWAARSSHPPFTLDSQRQSTFHSATRSLTHVGGMYSVLQVMKVARLEAFSKGRRMSTMDAMFVRATGEDSAASSLTGRPTASTAVVDGSQADRMAKEGNAGGLPEGAEHQMGLLHVCSATKTPAQSPPPIRIPWPGISSLDVPGFTFRTRRSLP